MPDGGGIRAYHERTKHSLASLQRSPHALDFANMPRPFKVYPELTALPLPQELEASSRFALETIADPGDGGDAPLDVAALARLLYFSAGVLRRKTYPGGEIYFRAAACTGALYHIELYLVCGALSGLEAGVYHFGAHDFALRRLRAGDHRRVVVEASGDEPALADAPAILACTTTFWRNAWKYRERAYRHAFWDAGTILANLLAVAAGTRLAARVVLGFVDATLDGLLDLDTEREATIALVALGRAGAAPPATPAVAPLGLATLPASAHEVDYPAIRAAHAAGALATPAAAAAWRRPLHRAPSPVAADAIALPSLPPEAVPEPVERAVLRRGSTRVFAREPITRDVLATILHAATRGMSADFAGGAPLADVYLIANAVDGLAPGAYAYDRARGAVELLRAGDFRRDAGHLGLGQELPRDAAVDVFWLADLDAVLGHFGDRGYRAAQIAAAIEGGKTYLAAYALGLGASGLTFFDDDVTAFFSPHAAGKAVMFLVAVGRPYRPPRAG